MVRFILNNENIVTEKPAGMVLLDFIRYHQRLTGTKIGCREGDCGACTVLVGEIENDEIIYHSVTSCLMPVGNAMGKHIVTVEGINQPESLTPVQQAFADCGATQCGFCTPGFIMSLTGFCLGHAEPDPGKAITAMDGNICRCTGYKSIERAAAHVAGKLRQKRNISWLVENNYLPGYFNEIKERLKKLNDELTKNVVPEPAAIPARAHVVGGGTDVYVQKHEEMATAMIHFVFDRPEMNGISIKDEHCYIGASATVNDLRQSEVMRKLFPRLDDYISLVSSTPIRNMATIAGNFINASPIGDFTVFFLALDAEVELSNGINRRLMPLRKLYKGYKVLDKTPDEFISSIRFKIPGDKAHFNFEKVSKRTHLDIASVNSAAAVVLDGELIQSAAISAGGVGPIPLYLEKTSAFLKGKKNDEASISEAISIMKTEISPISDARGSKEYKTLLLEQLILAHFLRFAGKIEMLKEA